MSGVTQTAVVRKVLQQASRDEANDDDASICFQKGGKSFFIPRPPNGLIYTDEQVDWIERVLHDFGIDLFPLDTHD